MPMNSDPRSSRSRPRPTRSAILVGPVLLPLVLLGAGCAPPQVEPEHRELILRLATATSVKDLKQLEAVAEEIDSLRASGTLGGSQEAAFEAIVTAGRAGDWDQARRRSYALRDAQQPTAADLDRLKSRTLPPPKLLDQDRNSL